MKRELVIVILMFLSVATKGKKVNHSASKEKETDIDRRKLNTEKSKSHTLKKVKVEKKIKAHISEKTEKKGSRERKLYTVVNPKQIQKTQEHNKIADKVHEHKKDKITSFTVPRGFRPGRSLSSARKTENVDDPTAGEQKIESIPLLLFGDYEIIIEKK